MRTGAVRDCGGFADADSGEDWVLGVSLAFRGRVQLHERPGRVYRRLGESLWERRRSPRHQLRHAAAVRRRLRQDPGVPGWARRAAPLLAPVQAVVLLGLARSHVSSAEPPRLPLSLDPTLRRPPDDPG